MLSKIKVLEVTAVEHRKRKRVKQKEVYFSGNLSDMLSVQAWESGISLESEDMPFLRDKGCSAHSTKET